MSRSDIDVAGLLTIDVASELRKLSQAQLQGPWQIPAEFVRRALKSGAKEVAVELGRHQARITDDGGGIRGEHLQWTAVLLDERRSNEERHAALTALEAAGELVLLAIAGLGVRELKVETASDGERFLLDYNRGRAPWVEHTSGWSGRSTEVSLRSEALDRRQVAQFIGRSARFAPANITIDGRTVPAGFADALAQAPLRGTLRGQLAIPADGETAHAWLLEYGLVTGHVAIPDAPCFEAAVELGSLSGELSAARLREAVQPHVGDLVDQAAALLIQLGHGLPHDAERLRARTARLVLQAARKRLRASEMARVPVFRVVDGQSGGGGATVRRVDLATLRAAAQKDPSGARMVTALYPSQRPDRYALGNAPVLIADEVERSRLAELMKLRFRPPDPRDASRSIAAALMRMSDAAARGFARAGDWIRHPMRAPSIPDAQLAPPELALVQALREQLLTTRLSGVQGVEVCRGTGPIRRSRGNSPSLLLPRGNSDVAAAVAAVAADADWVYPAALALLEGRGLPPSATRSRWLARGWR